MTVVSQSFGVSCCQNRNPWTIIFLFFTYRQINIFTYLFALTIYYLSRYGNRKVQCYEKIKEIYWPLTDCYQSIVKKITAHPSYYLLSNSFQDGNLLFTELFLMEVSFFITYKSCIYLSIIKVTETRSDYD